MLKYSKQLLKPVLIYCIFFIQLWEAEVALKQTSSP